MLGFCICGWSKLVFVLGGNICDCIDRVDKLLLLLLLSFESLVKSFDSGWARPPPSFHDAKLAGRKLGPCVVVVDIELINESDGDLIFLLSCVAKRGKSFKPSKFGGWPFVFPAVTVLHVADERCLSISEDVCCGGGVDALAGSESSCCCVGCFDGVNGRVWLLTRLVGVWFPLAVHPWLVPVGIVGSNDGTTPVSLFKLGKLAGGGIRRLLIFPRLAHPWVRAWKKKRRRMKLIFVKDFCYLTYQLLDSFRSYVFCLQNRLL